MPISVTCPSCSGTFKVKDEYAGKRGKCPKCAEPISIPAAGPTDTVKMPAPLAPARPVVASKPKPTPVDDEADEPVSPKRKRGTDEDEPPVSPKRKRGASDDEADEPVGPNRKRGASDDDETPKGKRRRRDDDDEPKKKGKALPIILGIVGGLLLLCGGGCAGVYFGVIVPAADKAKKELDAKASDLKNRAGDGGTAKPKVPTPVATLNPDQMAEQHQTYATKYVTLTGRLKGYEKSSGFGGSVGGKKLALYYVFVEGKTRAVTVTATEEDWPAASPPPIGSQVEFVGQVAGRPQQLELNFASLVAHTPPTGPSGGQNPTPNTGSGQEDRFAKVNPENMNKVRVGMTAKQVEEVLGEGHAAVEPLIKTVLLGNADDERWLEKGKEREVWKFGLAPKLVLVAFSQSVSDGGTVVAVRGAFGKDRFEPIKLPATGPGTVPPPAEGGVNEVTAVELAGAFAEDADAAGKKYVGKALRVKGAVGSTTQDGSTLSLRGLDKPGLPKAVLLNFNFPPAEREGAKVVRLGSSVTVVATLDEVAASGPKASILMFKDSRVEK